MRRFLIHEIQHNLWVNPVSHTASAELLEYISHLKIQKLSVFYLFPEFGGSTISPLLPPAEIMDLSHCSDVINHQMFTFCGRLRPFTIGLVGTKLLKSTDCKSHHSSFYE